MCGRTTTPFTLLVPRFLQGVPLGRWRGVFASSGVDPERIEFKGVAPTIDDHLRAIGNVDIALDPFPYQGTYTTLETLTMGVPVVCLMGETYSRRASAALLMRLGMTTTIAKSVDEYVDSAVSLANDEERLGGNRDAVRERFLNSEICDVSAYVAELETTYRRLWRDWCEKNPP